MIAFIILAGLFGYEVYTSEVQVNKVLEMQERNIEQFEFNNAKLDE